MVAGLVEVGDPEHLVEEEILDVEVGAAVRKLERSSKSPASRAEAGGRRPLEWERTEVIGREAGIRVDPDGVVEVDVLELPAVTPVDVGEGERDFRRDLTLEAEGQLVGEGGGQIAIDLRHRRGRLGNEGSDVFFFNDTATTE